MRLDFYRVFAVLLRAFFTFIYAAIGFLIAFPLSYWFQGHIYREMTWSEYVQSGTEVLFAGAQFGSFDVYRYSVIACIIGMIVLGRLIERRLSKNKH